MLYIVSYIIKILFSVTATYFLVYFQKEKQHLDKYEVLKYNFYCIFLLSPIYAISSDIGSYVLYASIIIILFLHIYKKNISCNNLYLLSLIISILIASNYIFYTLFGVAFYLFFENNLLDMFDENNES